jgi:hypothetical protein
MLLTVGFALTGCATTGVDRAAKTTNTMQTVQKDYNQVSSQVDATNASLREIISPNQTDMKRALSNYNADVAKMEKLGDRLDKDSADMRSQGQDYFAEWEKQGSTYTNPEIRQLSEERRLQLREVFAQIPKAGTDVNTSLHSYLVTIKEIRDYLSNDLTPSGVQGITPVAQRAMREGEDLKTSVQPVLAAIEHARTAMAQGGANRGTATGGKLPPAAPYEPTENYYDLDQ